MKPQCPICKKEMVDKFWTKDLDNCTCISCHIQKYWNKEKQCFASNREINQMKENWGEV